ncbi:unnamed protein product [Urochloa humidicola]
MAAGLPIAAAAVAVAMVAALPLLAAAGVAPSVDDCFTICFKRCIANDKSMTDYCNYACGMTCGGGGSDGALHRRPAALAGVLHMMNCQLACVRESCRPLPADGNDMETCYGQCYDGCNTKTGLPRLLRPAALPDHPFHKMQDAVQPTSEPDPLPRLLRPAALPDHPFHKMQDAVQPTSEPDPLPRLLRPAALPDHPFHKIQDAVQPTSEPDPDDVSRRASRGALRP